MINPHPGLPELEYVKPGTLAEACKFLEQHEGKARPFSGGTDCFVRLRDGVLKLEYLVDIKGLDGTKELSFDPKKRVNDRGRYYNEPGYRPQRRGEALS